MKNTFRKPPLGDKIKLLELEELLSSKIRAESLDSVKTTMRVKSESGSIYYHLNISTNDCIDLVSVIDFILLQGFKIRLINVPTLCKEINYLITLTEKKH